MTDLPTHPKGWHTVTPRIVVHNSREFVQFLKNVFGATGDYHDERPSEIRIGDSIIMVTEVGVRPATPAFLYVYVSDTDATYRRAIAAGARSIEEPGETPYGDRRSMIDDKWGNTWQIATRSPAKA
jgi:uncharacterized glyoxalase superfamily protein PhnB